MKKIAIIAALAASIAAPAFAQSASTSFAIAHFNQSAERASDIVNLPNNQNFTPVSLRGDTPLANAFALFNASADSAGDLIGLNGATVVGGDISHAPEIFARLREESRGEE